MKKKFDFKAGQSKKQAAANQRQRSRSRSKSPEHGEKNVPAWCLIADDSTPNPVVQISAQLAIEGALSFRVKTGLVECMGLVVGPSGGAQESNRAKTSKDHWINLVSGDALRRTNTASANSLILPITNVSGKNKQATIEIKELYDPEQVDASLLL